MIIMGKNSAILILVIVLLITPVVYFSRQQASQIDAAAPLQSTGYEPVVVIELFTSQGCSSCPPADRLLNQLVNSDIASLYAVSYHVDYWNYIGWTDPFSKAEYTAMQSAYNDKLKSRSNYTPELVINGKEHMVGSDATQIKNRIQAYSRQPASNAVKLSSAKWSGEKITADYEIKGEIQGRSVKAVLLLNERSTFVKRGENSGRTLLNTQIALTVNEFDLEATEGKIIFDAPEQYKTGDTLYLLLMTENSGHDKTGAGQIKVPDRT